MKLTFIDNACSLLEHDGFRLLTDPWLSEGAFEGSWFHYPAMTTTAETLPPLNAIWVSHLHPDHYDVASLRQIVARNPNATLMIMDDGKNYLHQIMTRDGFSNILTIHPNTPAELGPFRLTVYPPFASDVFHDAALGNHYDSALVIDTLDGAYSFFHGNDNNPTPDAAKKLRQTHGKFTVAQLKYNAASPYPACFMHLSESERLAEANRIMERNLDHLCKITEILQPQWVMPAAGSFLLGGKHHTKNTTLGTCSRDTAVERLTHTLPQQATLAMNEGQTLAVATGELLPATYTPVPWHQRLNYASQNLAQKPYPYEQNDTQEALAFIQANLPQCRQNLWRYQQRFSLTPAINVYLHTGNIGVHIPMDSNQISPHTANDAMAEPYLQCQLDPRLLARIMQRQAHWNNAEIGCHIHFWRAPDVYHPDLHVLLSFLHLPAKELAARKPTPQTIAASC